MGMFDTIVLDRDFQCVKCKNIISSTQTKSFDNTLDEYKVKDCPAHAEDIRIIKEELFCEKCREFQPYPVYLVVNRGILTGISDSLHKAKESLDDLNKEKLILWYHDLYHKYIKQKNDTNNYQKFLYDLREWWSEQKYKQKNKDNLFFLFFSHHFKGAISPIESVERFLTYTKMRHTLNRLWEEGHEELLIYHPEQIETGEEEWFADVYQDDMNERCDLNWTWSVASKKFHMSHDEANEEPLDWSIIVDEPYSEEVICQAVLKWLRERGFHFKVKMISVEASRRTGMLKILEERLSNLKEEECIPHEEVKEKLKLFGVKTKAEMVDQLKNKTKVFYYKGFYGSLVPCVETGMLVGKIEGINEIIPYEGKTVYECENKFREAVSKLIPKPVILEP
ncbi:MAG: hypothetical protein HQK77_20250 [Desulfobacterales bacterium]|nr:hypothetical protein [Desulfobacterales bacterium]